MQYKIEGRNDADAHARIPLEIDLKIRKIAKKKNVARSAIIRSILIQYFGSGVKEPVVQENDT